ncbi:MAG: hypothetical protein GY797_31555 [Deltaproteobacteria bacterium]|nr:hypothetical protein [Deltaproteobacteria bacterium]
MAFEMGISSANVPSTSSQNPANKVNPAELASSAIIEIGWACGDSKATTAFCRPCQSADLRALSG